ncbi:MAG: AI-2E family transporter, partial [Kiritimatiellae bacterium]|nr:AI-2E family transporter [Kiritimatiellia bacterium]
MEPESKRLQYVIFYGVVLLLGCLAYQIVKPFLMPLLWAGILALCAQPLHRRLAARIRPGGSALLSTAAVAL